jgi:hypothetical protein
VLEGDEALAKRMLQIAIELYNKRVWVEPTFINLIANGALLKN